MDNTDIKPITSITSAEIKMIRKANRWTQPQMATATGVVTSTVWRWENVAPPYGGTALALLNTLRSIEERKEAL